MKPNQYCNVQYVLDVRFIGAICHIAGDISSVPLFKRGTRESHSQSVSIVVLPVIMILI